MQRVLPEILYDSAKYVVINKPAGVAMQGKPFHPAARAWRELLHATQIAAKVAEPLKPVHRLDTATSGALILAKNATAARAIGRQLQAGDVRKTYWAVVAARSEQGPAVDWQCTPGSHGRIECEVRIGAERVFVCDPQKDGDADQKACKKAVTRWEVANATNTHAHLILMPETGRKHQLRVVCSDLLGGPIVGDFKYGYQGPPAGSGHLLHCFSLEFYVWGKSGRRSTVKVNAPIPTRFADRLRALHLRPGAHPFLGIRNPGHSLRTTATPGQMSHSRAALQKTRNEENSKRIYSCPAR